MLELPLALLCRSRADGLLKRRDAATLIIRSLYSVLAQGNPEGFPTYSNTPYFPTDVPSGHPSFPYVQKLFELGITTGCTSTQFCPDTVLTYGQAAIFAIRARRIRLSDTNPLTCTDGTPDEDHYRCTPYFADVPQSHIYFAQIQKTYELLSSQGLQFAGPGCPSGSFCPDSNMTRGYFAIYVVSLIMGTANLPPVAAPNNVQEGMSTSCNPGTLVSENHFVVVDANNAYAYGKTSLSPQPPSPQLWATYLADNLVIGASGYAPVDARTGGSDFAAIQTNTFALSANQDESFYTWHGVISGCGSDQHPAQPYISLTANSSIAGTGNVPAPWANQDIGGASIPGYTLYSPLSGPSTAIFTVGGSGSYVYYNTDYFRFISQSVAATSSIVVHVKTFQKASPTSKAGIMFRGTTDPAASNVFLAVDANGAILMQTRSGSGTLTNPVWGPAWGPTWPSAGVWLKLERSGTTFTGSASFNGSAWTSVASTSITAASDITAISTSLAGLAVTAENYGSAALATGVFDNVNVTGSTQTVPITITSVPSGLSVAVDGVPYSTPTTLQWVPGSQHQVDVVNIYQNAPPNTRYVSPTWSDGGAPVHTITAPTQGQTYTATFVTQYLVTTSPVPATAGAITLNPSGGWYNAGSTVSVTAVPNSSFYFFAFGGLLSGSTNPQNLTVNAPGTVSATFYPLYQDVTSSPPGLQIAVDGATCTTPCYFTWNSGTSHTIAVTNPTVLNGSLRYVFSNWSDGGAQSHTITVPSGPITYTANYATQFLLTTSANPGTGGTISPPTGFYNSGSLVTVAATPSAGYRFAGFTGALTGATSQSLTMSSPQTVTGNFTTSATSSFAVTATPSVQSVAPAAAVAYVITVSAAVGFAGTTALSISGLPQGTTAAFGPPSISGSGTSSLSVATTTGSPLGSFPITITATNGSVSRIATAVLTVVPSGSATIVSPALGATLASTISTFVWNSGAGVSSYQLTVGSAPGGSDYFSSGSVSAQSATVTLPNVASPTPIYVTLGSLIAGAWQSQSSVYTLDLTAAAAAEGSLSAVSVSYVYNDSQPKSVALCIQRFGLCDDSQDATLLRSCTVVGGVSAVLKKLGSESSSHKKSGLDVEFTADRSAPTNTALNLTCVRSDGGSYFGPAVITVYDAAPVITSVDQYPPDYPGGAFYVHINGKFFGNSTGTLSLCQLSVNPCTSPADVSIDLFDGPNVWTDDHGIAAWVTPTTPTASGTYEVALNSTGAYLGHFQPGPQQTQSQARGGRVTVTPAALTSVSQVTKYNGNTVPILYLSTGDTSGRVITTSVNPNNATFGVTYAVTTLSNPNSTCQANLTVPAGNATGFINSPVTAALAGCSGIFSVKATANGRESINDSSVVVPPQILIQMLYGEARGQPGIGDNVSMRAVGVAARNRLSQPIFQVTTYQDDIGTPGQYKDVVTTLLNGPDNELSAASEVFSNTTAVDILDAGCFFSPTKTDWLNIQGEFTNPTGVIPVASEDPKCYRGTSNNRQMIIKQSVGMNADGRGAPAFIFERARPSSTDPFVIEIP